MRQKTCSACGGKMQSLGNMELQKGRFSMLFGNLSQIMSGALDNEEVGSATPEGAASTLLRDVLRRIAGALDVDVECCERCKKLEFYLLGDPEEPEPSGIEQIACPYCGDMHDMDDAICPHCGRRLMEL